MVVTHARIVGPREGRQGWLGGLGIRFMVPGADSGGGFSMVEHPLAPRALAAPLHRHSREDEYSYVVSGRVGALLGDEVVYGGAGGLFLQTPGPGGTILDAGPRPRPR